MTYALLGADLLVDLSVRAVPGYPNAGQFHFYVFFPCAMVLLNAVLVCLARWLYLWTRICAFSLQLLAFVVFCFLYNGGV